MSSAKPAVLYLARGADSNAEAKFAAFVRSYSNFPAGVEHDLFIVMKGFASTSMLHSTKDVFKGLAPVFIEVDDNSFDIGAYRDTLKTIPHERLCFLNTNSEICSASWLLKLCVNLDRDNVGVVSASGSFESLSMMGRRFPAFPNVHIRSNAFLMHRNHFLAVVSKAKLSAKLDAWLLESGDSSFTRYVFSLGLDALIVGRNGRGYSSAWWTASDTFRQGEQSNLLVSDNVTRSFDDMTWSDKADACRSAWGDYINNPGNIVVAG
ncbi:hypothetical protein [Methylocella silvestris]|uniref:Glycosyltransferase n=1 Tax=Methylocella silvestris TaxID=199596 RepID=A0A2J7TE37_METSI|nr:hypothetical protein [Methylocella silvestris]PNG25031.1 hypothetical protein CR492_15380 [Methylocella silvestris]